MAERGRAPGRTQGYAGTWPPREAARAGGFAPSGFGEWSSLLKTLRASVRAEAGAGRLLPWVPIAFGAGIAFYFGADHEPVGWATAVTAIAFVRKAFWLARPSAGSAYLPRRCPAQARVRSRCTTRRRAIRIAMPAILGW